MPKASVVYTSDEVMEILRGMHDGADVKIQNPRKPRDPNAPKKERKAASPATATARR